MPLCGSPRRRLQLGGDLMQLEELKDLSCRYSLTVIGRCSECLSQRGSPERIATRCSLRPSNPLAGECQLNQRSSGASVQEKAPQKLRLSAYEPSRLTPLFSAFGPNRAPNEHQSTRLAELVDHGPALARVVAHPNTRRPAARRPPIEPLIPRLERHRMGTMPVLVSHDVLRLPPGPQNRRSGTAVRSMPNSGCSPPPAAELPPTVPRHRPRQPARLRPRATGPPTPRALPRPL